MIYLYLVSGTKFYVFQGGLLMVDLLQMKGKNIVVMGVANERSIAWGVATQLFAVGANVLFTYRSERSLRKLKRQLEKENLQPVGIVQMDANDDASIEAAFEEITQHFDQIDGLVHSAASADPSDLRDDFSNTSRDGFKFALETSAYSLVAVAKAASPHMSEGSSIITMTYLGSTRVMPGYNVMGVAKAALESAMRYLAFELGEKGIRVNAISAGPIKTISARGVASFNTILDVMEEHAPLRRNVTKEEVGNMTVAMLSPLSSGVTGEVVFVDAGYHITG